MIIFQLFLSLSVAFPAIIICLIYMLSQGWNITEFELSKKLKRNAFIIFGAVYIMRLLEGIGFDSEVFNYVISLVICLLYLGVLIVSNKSITTQIRMIRDIFRRLNQI